MHLLGHRAEKWDAETRSSGRGWFDQAGEKPWEKPQQSRLRCTFTKHVKPLVSEYGSYVTAVNSIQSDGGLQECLKILLKGASIQSRHLPTWGEVRDAIAKQAKKRMLERKLEQLKKGDSDPGAFERHYNEIYEKLGCEEVSTYEFLQPELANTQGDVACEKVVIAIPREPLDFVQRAV